MVGQILVGIEPEQTYISRYLVIFTITYVRLFCSKYIRIYMAIV